MHVKRVKYSCRTKQEHWSQSDLQRNFSGVNTFCMFNLKQYVQWKVENNETKHVWKVQRLIALKYWAIDQFHLFHNALLLLWCNNRMCADWHCANAILEKGKCMAGYWRIKYCVNIRTKIMHFFLTDFFLQRLQIYM